MTEERRKRREAATVVHDVVSALRAISAGRIQGARRALESARRYHEIVLEGMAIALAELDSPGNPAEDRGQTTLLVLTGEQALSGGLDQEILALALARLESLGGRSKVRLVVAGKHGIRRLAARNIVPDVAVRGATALSGLTDLAKRLASCLQPRGAGALAPIVHAVHGRYESALRQVATEAQVLPPDFTQIATARLLHGSHGHYPDAQEVLDGLIHEFAFICLYQLAAEAFASEQGSRLVAMDAATSRAKRMVDNLLALERQERRAQITRQVLESLASRTGRSSRE